jgi:Uma2 family endonuclease
MALPLRRLLFTVDQYHQLEKIGVLTEDDRVELIHGEIVEMAPIGERHFGHVNRFNYIFSRLFGDRALLHIQNPVRLGPRIEPEPDVVLLKPRDDFYETGVPTPADVLLLIEIADSSVEYDRNTKVPLYGQAGIVEYWLVNLVQDQIVVYRDPSPTGYRTVQVFRPGDAIQPLLFPDVTIAVSDVLHARSTHED